jgi:hypothetical protein
MHHYHGNVLGAVHGDLKLHVHLVDGDVAGAETTAAPGRQGLGIAAHEKTALAGDGQGFLRPYRRGQNK